MVLGSCFIREHGGWLSSGWEEDSGSDVPREKERERCEGKVLLVTARDFYKFLSCAQNR